LTSEPIYAIVGFYHRMTMKAKEKVMQDLVGWCVNRSKELSDEDDQLALLMEFEDWILYENGEISEFDFITFSIKN